MTASAVDLEFRTLQSVGAAFGGEEDESLPRLLSAALSFFDRLLQTRTSFQAVAAYLDLLLTIYHQEVVAHSGLHKTARALATQHTNAWGHLEQLLQNNLCMLQYFSGQQ